MKKFAHLLAVHQPEAMPAATLNGRAGQYLNAVKKEAKAWRPVSFEIMTATVKIFEQFNDTRNNASLAHDNQLVAKAEATFIFDGVVNLLRFLKATEGANFGRETIGLVQQASDVGATMGFGRIHAGQSGK